MARKKTNVVSDLEIAKGLIRDADINHFLARELQSNGADKWVVNKYRKMAANCRIKALNSLRKINNMKKQFSFVF